MWRKIVHKFKQAAISVAYPKMHSNTKTLIGKHNGKLVPHLHSYGLLTLHGNGTRTGTGNGTMGGHGS